MLDELNRLAGHTAERVVCWHTSFFCEEGTFAVPSPCRGYYHCEHHPCPNPSLPQPPRYEPQEALERIIELIIWSNRALQLLGCLPGKTNLSTSGPVGTPFGQLPDAGAMG